MTRALPSNRAARTLGQQLVEPAAGAEVEMRHRSLRLDGAAGDGEAHLVMRDLAAGVFGEKLSQACF
ncbi:MAG: hypothetical protein IOC82_11360 [Aestuariivirga sp.]|nr:hypothetical protein [Aestuariivirga sp.]